MSSLRKRLAIAHRKRSATHASGRPAKPEGKIVWVYKPLDLPFRAKHLTDEQIQDAVEKLPA